MSVAAALMSSDRMDWNTPRVVLDALRPLGPVVLDPCSNPRSLVDATFSISRETGGDGLATIWAKLYLDAVAGDDSDHPGFVYVNPPYGRDLPRWVEKCVMERAARIVLLCPARPDTKWFSRIVETASSIAFWRGRLMFEGAPANAPFPSMLAYWDGAGRPESAKHRFEIGVRNRANVWRLR